MLRIRRVYSTVLPVDRDRVEQVQQIFRDSFPDVARYADKIPDQLNRPFRYGYRAILLISETGMGKVTGFALLFHLPEVDSSLLDFLAVRSDIRGSGLGGTLYEAAREYLVQLGSRGMYMEVPPDDPAVVTAPAVLKANRDRLRFYEQYGVRPIAGTEFETPIDQSPAPYLLFDGLGREEPLSRSEARAAVRLILTRKYSDLVTPDYIERVVESFVDDPVRFREPAYVTPRKMTPAVAPGRVRKAFGYVMSPGHQTHHVHDQGYVERPARIGAIEEALATLPFFEKLAPREFRERHIVDVHAADFVLYLKRVCQTLNSKRPVYPYVFPIRRPERRPRDLSVRAGYYCIDTFTPLDGNAYSAARKAVDVALTAADAVLHGQRLAYALCRPPGHHAEHRVFGGFCYFNNAAIAAHLLAKTGRVALLDIDYHHGNGSQDIFYKRKDVLTLSIHGHPNFAYPYFSGFADEIGEGEGRGFNRNFPLPEDADETLYLKTLQRALAAIRRFDPAFLVVSLGLDIVKGDPTGTFRVSASLLREVGRQLALLDRPTLVVQEGGYNLRNLRRGVTAFFTGLHEEIGKLTEQTPQPRSPDNGPNGRHPQIPSRHLLTGRQEQKE